MNGQGAGLGLPVANRADRNGTALGILLTDMEKRFQIHFYQSIKFKSEAFSAFHILFVLFINKTKS